MFRLDRRQCTTAPFRRSELARETAMLVERYKRKRLPTFPEIYEQLKKAAEPIPGEKLIDVFYPGIDVEWNTYQKRLSLYNKWLEKEHGLFLQSTECYRNYSADVVRDYRRK
jgi:hypothetical protein